jgi:adenosine deaminase
MGLVPPEGLRFHIRESVERGHAERIGHGVDIMYETDPLGLMREMAERHVLVEICLTSNDAILGVAGARHPLATYRKYGVPVALATDDEGVSRSDMTQEYLKGAMEQGLTYSELKQMARASLEHSFLPGASLWDAGRTVTACADSDALRNSVSDACNRFLLSSEKARLQWREEAEFERFERKY